ncbi:MAG: gamma-glutamyl-phosphate reductase, partial [Planctomycetota bacterium]
MLAFLDGETKDAVLRTLAASIRASVSSILEANATDLADANEAGIGDAKLRRLELSESSLEQMAAGLEQIAAMP